MTSSVDSRGAGIAVAVCVLGLAALDLARPYLGTGLRPWQWALGIGAVVGVWFWRRDVPMAALAALLIPVAVDHSRNLESDGIHYYSYLRSLLFDQDLDLANDYGLLGWHDPAHHNVLPVGPAVLWSPFVLVVHAGREAARLFGFGPPNGAEPVYQAAACLGSVVYGSLGLFLLLGTLRRFLPPWVAFFTTLLSWVGSPLRFYLDVLPCLAHVIEFAAAVLVLHTTWALRDGRTPLRAAAAGAACGLVFLARSQDGLLLLVPLVALGAGLRTDPRGTLRLASLLGIAFVLVATPQMAVWQAMFGKPVLVPHTALHGSTFMRLTEPELVGTLVSPRGGLFLSYPALFLAVLGLAPLARREPRYAVSVFVVFLAMWYVNATVFDWYQVRRYTGVVPLLAPALAVWVGVLARRTWLLPALAAFLAFRYDLAVDSLRGQPGDPAPPAAVAHRLASDGARDAYRWSHTVLPGTAASLLGAVTGRVTDPRAGIHIDLSRDPLPRLPEPARHLSAVTMEDGRPCRWVTERETRLFVPLSHPEALTIDVDLRALETEEPQAVEALWNDTPVGRADLPPAWVTRRFHVPRAVVRPGTNILVLRFDRGPIYRRVRGVGPRQVRPAALTSVTVGTEAAGAL